MFEMVPFKRNGLSKRGDDFFNNFLGNFFDDDFFTPAAFMGNSFKVDLRETEDAYIVEADLPGVPKEAINIDYEKNYLTISAKREDRVEEKKDNYVRRERHYGEFRRSFYVDNIDESKISANFKDGVLTVNLPKLDKEVRRRKRIDIQ
ncbi:heat shock protein Hsp18 [Clostridium thermarum]|uniref:heat shock protein Hsp18 n=1 Tax=Clostridium thermarum TaxID=1716543 RepID=UPI0013D532E2|nr:heat shock protein Hsp18 [Clostridium thermarum]